MDDTGLFVSVVPSAYGAILEDGFRGLGMYRLNRIEAEPCGTPASMLLRDKVLFTSLTLKVRFAG